jgi:hypothetical protein
MKTPETANLESFSELSTKVTSSPATPEPSQENEPSSRRDTSPGIEDKTHDEIEKIRLEKRLLERQLSSAGLVMEWLKAATVPAALIAAAITFLVGYGQITQSVQSRDADRFDKALSRLASEKANDRLTGVAGLRLFADDPTSPLRVPALQFLVNATSVEADELVQGAISDVFRDLKSTQMKQAQLNEVLQTALEDDRSLTEFIDSGYIERRDAARAKVLEHHFSSSQFAKTPPLITPPFTNSLIVQLSQKEYLQFLAAGDEPFSNLDAKLSIPLHGLAGLIFACLTLQPTETGSPFNTETRGNWVILLLYNSWGYSCGPIFPCKMHIHSLGDFLGSSHACDPFLVPAISKLQENGASRIHTFASRQHDVNPRSNAGRMFAA